MEFYLLDSASAWTDFLVILSQISGLTDPESSQAPGTGSLLNQDYLECGNMDRFPTIANLCPPSEYSKTLTIYFASCLKWKRNHLSIKGNQIYLIINYVYVYPHFGKTSSDTSSKGMYAMNRNLKQPVRISQSILNSYDIIVCCICVQHVLFNSLFRHLIIL